jgi:hypothetical protein
MGLADTEIGRLLGLVDDLGVDEWQRPTDYTGWTVRDMLGNLLGMMKLQGDREERERQIKTAAELAHRVGAEIRVTHPDQRLRGVGQPQHHRPGLRLHDRQLWHSVSST